MKQLKTIGIIVLAVIVLFVAIVATQPYRTGLEINSKIAAIKANRDPVCGKDFIPNIPDSRNGALVYERVFCND